MATGRNIVAFREKDRESLALDSRHSRPSELPLLGTGQGELGTGLPPQSVGPQGLPK
jgi:hypothetical protein